MKFGKYRPKILKVQSAFGIVIHYNPLVVPLILEVMSQYRKIDCQYAHDQQGQINPSAIFKTGEKTIRISWVLKFRLKDESIILKKQTKINFFEKKSGILQTGQLIYKKKFQYLSISKIVLPLSCNLK